MDSQTNSNTFGYPAPPSSSATRLRGLWSRPIATMPAPNDRVATFKEGAAYFAPCCGGLFTVIAVISIILFINKAHSHAKFSIQSITVSPSAATWHVDFLVINPSSRYSIQLDGDDDAAVRLGALNAAVLNISHIRSYRDLTAFKLAFVAEGNRNDAVSEQLDIKLRAKHKLYVYYDEAGHFDVRCRNLTRSHENIGKIKCQSSFKRLEMLSLN